jgi:hypothetical protein
MSLSTKESLHQIIEQLSETECQQVLSYVRHLPTVIPSSLKPLVNDPTFKIPTSGFAPFQAVQAISGEGVLASQLLLEDRR